jgi:hypothetical protein
MADNVQHTTPTLTAQSGSGSAPQVNQAMDTNVGLDLGGVYRQCSTARTVGNSVAVTTVGSGNMTTESLPVPKIGSLDWNGDPAVLKTFHGGRISKNGRTSNECISSSYDPRNLICLGCEAGHSILNNEVPVTLIFSDQNFLPFLSGGPSSCIGIVRGENFSLGELGDIAAEILDKKLLLPGSVLLFGSASHLYKVGASNYINDWIQLVNRCSQRWPCINICPLVPVCRTDCPGDLVREIEILASWLGRVYANSTSGLLDSWRQLLQIYQAALDRSSPAAPPATLKTTLPTSLSLSSAQPHTFVFRDPCPDTVKGLDSNSTALVISSLLGALSRDFSVSYNAEIIVARYLAGSSDNSGGSLENKVQLGKQVLIIGASNMRRLVPVLQASGFNVVDLSRSSWLATEANIASLIQSLTNLTLEPGFSVILELFGNSTYRYKQFDDSLSLPYKDGAGYHMGGDVAVCEDDTFLKLLTALAPVLLSCQNNVKIVVPPLPRYLYHKCCNKSGHASNVHNEDHCIKMLDATAHFKSLLDTGLRKMGVENFFVLDGIAALLGYGPKENRPLNAEIAADLKPVFVKDGVHYTEMGYRNLAKCTAEAMLGILDGSLRVQPAAATAATAAAATPAAKLPPKRPAYFWRGFSSPVGSRNPTPCPPPTTATSATRANPVAYHARGGATGPPQGRHFGRNKYHPYNKN